MLSRVPLGPANEGMSTHGHVVLDVDTFDVKGAIGEDVWGKPVDVELDPDVKLWVEGLREGGGGGNVLKVRKQEQEKKAAADEAEKQAAAGGIQPSIKHAFRPQRAALPPRKTTSTSKTAKVSPPVEDAALAARREKRRQDRRSRFQLVTVSKADVLAVLAITELSDPTLMTEAPVRPPAPMHTTRPATPKSRSRSSKSRHALDLGSSPSSSAQPSPGQRPTTPTDWSPSQKDPRDSSRETASRTPSVSSRSIPPSVPETNDEGDSDGEELASATSAMIVDHPSSPSRQKERSDDDDVPHVPSQAILNGNGTQASNATHDSNGFLSSYLSAPTPAQRPRPLTPSSSPRPSLPSPSSPARKAPRRVARAVRGRNGGRGGYDGGRVLVPNSDTSGLTGSQSQPSQGEKGKVKGAMWVLLGMTQEKEKESGVGETEEREVAELGTGGIPEKEKEDAEVAAEGVQSQEMEGTQSQDMEQPIAQSLSYTSESQSKSQSQPPQASQSQAQDPELGQGAQQPESQPDVGSAMEQAGVGDAEDVVMDEDVVDAPADEVMEGVEVGRELGGVTQEEVCQPAVREEEEETQETDVEEEGEAGHERPEVVFQKEEEEESQEYEEVPEVLEDVGEDEVQEAEEEESQQDGELQVGARKDEEEDGKEEEEEEEEEVGDWTQADVMSSDDEAAAASVQKMISSSPPFDGDGDLSYDGDEDEDGDDAMIQAMIADGDVSTEAEQQVSSEPPAARTFSPVKADVRTEAPALENRGSQEKEEGRGRQRSRSPHPSVQRTPSLPSEPDVFMDQDALSAHNDVSKRKGSPPRRVETAGRRQDVASASHNSVARATLGGSAAGQANATAGPSTPASGAAREPGSGKTPKTTTRYLFHDPEAWALPTFLRSSSKGKQREVAPPATTVTAAAVATPREERTLKRKRPVDDSTPATITDVRPGKKLKQEAASPRAKPSPERHKSPGRSQAGGASAAADQKLSKSDSLTSTVTRIRRIDLRRESSVASSHSSSGRPRQKQPLNFSVTRVGRAGAGARPDDGGQADAIREGRSAESRTLERKAESEKQTRQRIKLGGFRVNLGFEARSDSRLASWEVVGQTLASVRQRRQIERERRRSST
ncbi:hypothetical protein BDW22DRAFT_544526 [Trametopsis cervina]|nr:hypothetical protein BDW22DRAFT_544526 [Trametopsis cervina]